MKFHVLIAATLVAFSCYGQEQEDLPAQGSKAKFRKYDIGTNLFAFTGWDHQKYNLEFRKTTEGINWLKAAFSYAVDIEDMNWLIVESTDTTIEAKSWNTEQRKFQLRLGMDWSPNQTVGGLKFGMGLLMGYSPERFQYRYSMKEQTLAGTWMDHHYSCNNGRYQVYDPDKGGAWTQHFLHAGMEVILGVDFYISHRFFLTFRGTWDISYNWQMGETIRGDSDNWYRKKDDYYDIMDFNLQLILRYKI